MKGWRVEKSHENVYLWAQKEDPVALHILGTLHKKGKGVEKSFVKAREFFEQSARLCHCPAQNELGCLYMNREGGEPSALKWLELAAEQGHPAAQRNLGNRYMAGIGVNQSNEKGLAVLTYLSQFPRTHSKKRKSFRKYRLMIILPTLNN